MPLAQGSGAGIQVLVGEVSNRASKGELAAEPLVEHHGERILITGRTGLAEDLLGGHVGQGAEPFFELHGLDPRGEQGQAKIAEQHLVFVPQQHILRLEITMDHVLIMGML